MRLHTSAFVAVAFVGGCMSQAQTTPEYGDSYAGLSTGPDEYNEPWAGPPGGGMDPGYGYEDPALAQSPSEQSADPNANGVYGGAMYGGETDPNAWADPMAPADPNATGEWAGATSEVTDAQIDVTLEAYGEWVEDPDYGRVWRPYTTVVGADFTPYESCGSWTYTDYGWTFQSCDEWSWGWLPFHFGRWVYLDNSWCWSRDYTWGPGWVEWRHGGGYVGWRPLRPTRQIRDHRDRHNGPDIRDHRRGQHEKWRFTRADDFGRRPIRSSPSIGVREGLRATTSVAQPPIRGDRRNRVSTVMAGRLRDHQRFETRTRGQIGQSTRGYQPSNVGPSRGYNNNVGAIRTNPRTRGSYNPTYNPNVTAPNANRPTWNRGGIRYNAPANGNRAPQANNRGYRYNPPANNRVNGGYRYNPPTNGTRTPPVNRGGYNPPANNRGNGGYRYNPPSRPSPSFGGSRGTTTGPTRPNTNWGGSRSSSPAPSRSYTPPSRSSAPSRSYTPPSRSSAPSRSYTPPSRSSAPSRSYSAPSRSYSAPSRSSSSSSRGSSSSSSSRGSSSGGSRGGRHR